MHCHMVLWSPGDITHHHYSPGFQTTLILLEFMIQVHNKLFFFPKQNFKHSVEDDSYNYFFSVYQKQQNTAWF